MPKADLAFAVRSIETSSIALRRQMEKSGTRQKALDKLDEALQNHQRTLGRLMRMRPLQELGLCLAMGGEIGKLQQALDELDFVPRSSPWKRADGAWKKLQGQSLTALEREAKKALPDAGAVRKAFGLALLTGALALFLDEKAPRLSMVMAEDRYKTALSELTMEQMV